jgi:WD40 repeat protein
MTVIDMADGKILANLRPHNRGPLNLSFSQDGKQAFTCGGDGSVVMWDVRSLKRMMQFRGNDQYGMTSADLSTDGRRVVTTTQSGSWQLWDASNGAQLLDVRASSAPLSSATFSADGQAIFTADGTVRVWRSLQTDPATYVPIEASYLPKLNR